VAQGDLSVDRGTGTDSPRKNTVFAVYRPWKMRFFAISCNHGFLKDLANFGEKCACTERASAWS
jgi:hypothetical protein